VRTVSEAAQTTSSGDTPRYNQPLLGNPGQPPRSADRVVVAWMRGQQNLAERRTRGPRRSPVRPEAGWLITPTTKAGGSPGDEGPVKPGGGRGHADVVLNPGGRSGRAGLRGLGLKPYWGKLTVRNFRGGAGNVTMGAGLRPASKAADEPPDPKVDAPALYPAGLSSRVASEGAREPGDWR